MIHMGHGHGVYIDAALKMARRYPNIYLEMSGMPMHTKLKKRMIRLAMIESYLERILLSIILQLRCKKY